MKTIVIVEAGLAGKETNVIVSYRVKYRIQFFRVKFPMCCTHIRREKKNLHKLTCDSGHSNLMHFGDNHCDTNGHLGLSFRQAIPEWHDTAIRMNVSIFATEMILNNIGLEFPMLFGACTTYHFVLGPLEINFIIGVLMKLIRLTKCVVT